MSIELLASAPPKLSIANVETAEIIEAQFNPNSFSLSLQVNYENVKVPGAGYEVLQYSNTGNPQIPLELFYTVVTEEEMEQRDAAEKFLLALCYPRRGASTVPQHAPPRALVVWPNYASLLCVVRQIQIRGNRFNLNGEPIEEVISLTLEEIRDGNIFSSEVQRQGLRRSSPNAIGGRRNGS